MTLASGLAARLDAYFELSSRGSRLSTEVLAGVSTFLALSYIFVVNPAILANAGMDRSMVLFATIATSAFATIAMGLWPRLPFVLAPGMEMNAYVAFYAVGVLGLTWQQSLGAVFWSGVLFIVLTWSGFREEIIRSIPDRMKGALSLAVGVFLVLVALRVAGIARYDGVRFAGLGELWSPSALVLYATTVVVLVLDRLRIRAAVLLSILGGALLSPWVGVPEADATAEVSSRMLSGVGALDLGVIADPKAWSVILVLFLIDFYGSVAKFIGLTRNTPLMQAGVLPRLRQALVVDGAAALTGASLGTSSVLVYVESGVGIGAGGRTGITAIVCGFLMLGCFAIAPLLQFVPTAAATGALVYVAIKLCPTVAEIRRYRRLDLFALGAMQVTVILTFALDRAMLAGCVTYLGVDLLLWRKPNLYLVGSTALLAAGWFLQAR